MTKKRVGIVLSAGGLKGSFEVGALRYLYDNIFQQPPDLICGTSAGALNGAVMAQGDTDGERAIDILEAAWRQIKTDDDFYIEQDWFHNAQEVVRDMQAEGREIDDTWYLSLPIDAFEITADVQAIKDLYQLVSDNTDGNENSLYDPQPVRDLLTKNLDPEKVKNSGIQLRLVTTSLEEGQSFYITEKSIIQNTPDIATPHIYRSAAIDLIDAVMASSAIPLLFPPISVTGDEKFGSHNFVDGGLRAYVPMRLAVEYLKVDTCYTILTDSTLFPEVHPDTWTIAGIGNRIQDILLSQVVIGNISPGPAWKAEEIFISPRWDFMVNDGSEVNPGHISINIANGFFAADEAIFFKNNPKVNRFPLEENTDDILHNRIDTWQAEEDFAGEVAVWNVANNDVNANRNSPSSISLPGDLKNAQNTLNNILVLKQKLKDLLTERLQLGGKIPPDVHNWANNWETHAQVMPMVDPNAKPPWA